MSNKYADHVVFWKKNLFVCWKILNNSLVNTINGSLNLRRRRHSNRSRNDKIIPFQKRQGLLVYYYKQANIKYPSRIKTR